MSKEEVHAEVAKMGKEYKGNLYHLLQRNCNHFSEDLAYRLCQGRPPSWVPPPLLSPLPALVLAKASKMPRGLAVMPVAAPLLGTQGGIESFGLHPNDGSQKFGPSMGSETRHFTPKITLNHPQKNSFRNTSSRREQPISLRHFRVLKEKTTESVALFFSYGDPPYPPPFGYFHLVLLVYPRTWPIGCARGNPPPSPPPPPSPLVVFLRILGCPNL